ncbi:MAG: reprolysin-like metallopeptidase [Maribacter sp.]
MVTKLRLLFTITIAFLSFYGAAQDTYWKNTELKGEGKQFSKKQLQVDHGQAFILNESNFKDALFSGKNGNIVYFPDEHGKRIAFKVEETPLFSAELAQKYPNIKSFKGYALKDASKQIRFSMSHKGIQSMITITGENGALFMQKSDKDTYVVYRRTEQTAKDIDFICRTKPSLQAYSQNRSAKLIDDQSLRVFRVAIAASGEYTQFHGGTKADALAAINATLTRVNGVFERDLAVRLELIGTTDAVIYLDPETDPYSGGLSTQAQNTFASVIGEANYDIGHLFNQEENTLDGNSGFIGAVCQDNKKGSAYTTLSTPIGDVFDIDLVAHEMGHQFGANHSFSHISEGTLVQVEPASGSTIMGYAGITGNNNVAQNSDDYFHYVSIKQIGEYLATISCGQTIALSNTPPSMTPLLDYTIPKGTAFVLTGNATDVDGDVITYAWEQIDNGIVTQATFGPNNPAGANFRSLPPTTSPQRYFPKLERILSGQLTQSSPTVGQAWETVSNIGRDLNFSVTARDNAIGGGQSASDEVNVSVRNDAGPFLITSQNETVAYVAGSVQTITWDVANTNVAPIGANTVDILLSTDGGLTYPNVLLANTANDGTQEIIVPSIATSTGRIMIRPSNNIFFAVNTANVSIIPSEVILNFDQVVFDVCKPNDLSIDFVYETYLGFTEESTFSVTSLPPGLSVLFSPATATATETPITMDITGINSLAEGTYDIQVLATSTTITKTITLQLRVFDTNFDPVVLTSPINGFQDASVNKPLEWEDSIGNTSYDVEIASDNTFTTIIESATVLDNSYEPALLDNNSEYFWRIKPKNNCGEGVFSNAFSFRTIQFNCNTKDATGLPLTISSSGTPVVRSTITFFEDLPLADINVNINLEHTFLGDLVINLISPSGTSVALVSSSCGEFDDITATFDDDANVFSCGNEPAINGRVRPLGALSSFNGESILGEWTLEIRDNATSDGGRLNSFSLEVCVEGDFRPDADNDGVFDDGDDLCPDTSIGQEVNANGCPVYRFPNQNFSISLESETCRDNDDGKILITPKTALDYQVNVSGNGLELNQDFTNSFNLNNLASGTYTICITGTDGLVTYEPYCVDVEITQPEELVVTSITSMDESQITLNLKGSNSYNIELNGIVTQTSLAKVVLPLKKGLNTLKVFTDIACQGIYQEQFGNFENPIVFPNPVLDVAEVYVGFDIQNVSVQVFTVDGRWVENRTEIPVDGKIAIDFSAYATGIYYLKFLGKTVKGTSKVIKR